MPLAQYWSLLAQYLQRQTGKVVLLAALIFSGVGFQLINPQVVRYFIDTAMADGTTRQLISAASLFFVIALVRQAVSLGAGYLSEDIGWQATNALRADLAEHCLRLDMAFHNKHTPGEMIERIDGDVQILANFFSHLMLRVVGSGFLIVGVLAVLFFEDWRIGLVLTGFTLLIIVYLQKTLPLIVPYAEENQQVNAEVSSFLEERLAATEDIGASGAKGFVLNQLYQLYRRRWPIQRKNAVVVASILGIFNTSLTAFNAVGLALGIYFFWQGAITLGTVYLLYQYTVSLFSPLRQLLNQASELQKTTASLNRIQQFLAIKSDLPGQDQVQLPATIPAVHFQNVSFAYEADQPKPILHRLSFDVDAGQVLGVLGRTGSGKTTIARLLLRLYDPTSGQIRLGDTVLQTITPAYLRTHVGMVTQDVQLLRATVRENLTFFDSGLSDDQIWRALEQVELATWARELPKGLDTKLTGSSGLSAGEAQLLALARVFLKNPKLIILDEASSRLDPATEQRIERAIDQLLANRTAIIIAHRLTTVQRADQILVLEAGKIAEYGPRTTLAQNPDSHFFQLMQTGLGTATT
ncbi:MAG: ABC transporter ATP-binding protein [Chloroflexota bacterium]